MTCIDLFNMNTRELQCLNAEKLGMLSGKQYNISELEHIVKYTGTRLWTIVRTQYLTYDFCMNYILNEEYAVLDTDQYISIDDIVQYQPHLSKDFDV